MKIRKSLVVFFLVLFSFWEAPFTLTSSILNIFNFNSMNETVVTKSLYSSVFTLTEDDKSWVENTLNKMTLEEKCAQMIMMSVPANATLSSTTQLKQIIKYVEENKVGGLIFFQGDALNQAAITNAMQEISKIPLLIASDFENGVGMRLNDATEFPHNMALGAAGDLNLAYQMGKILSAEAKAIGVHQNFAPVADINNNPGNPVINTRSYSDDKDIVSRFATAFILGSKQHKIITTVKHFPGHGNTKVDSHKDLPKINIDKYNLANNELVPFIQAIRAGVHSVMIGHIEVPAIEPEYRIPASLSQRVVTDLLQGEMGFDGLVVTDAMNMNAITKYYSPSESTVMAVIAGNDIVLMPTDSDVAIGSLVNAVNIGDISEERIDYSVRKILSAKRWLGLDKDRFSEVSKIKSVVKQNSHLRLANDIAEKSITLVKDTKDVIPLDPKKIYKTACITITDGRGTGSALYFQDILDNYWGYVNKIVLTRNSNDRDYNKALQIAQQSDVILLPSFIKVKTDEPEKVLSSKQFEFIRNLFKQKKTVIMISFDNPYLLSYFPETEVYLASFGNTRASQRAMLKGIIGKNSIRGTLPITIPDTEFHIGDGKKIKNTSLDFISLKDDNYFNFSPIEVAMLKGINNKIFPGGVLVIGKNGKVIFNKPFGRFTYEPASTLMSSDAIFDLSSLTQVVAATSAAMILYDEGKLKLDEKVSTHLPEFGNNGKENITIKNLLEHNSGLPADINIDINSGKKYLINSIMNLKHGNTNLISDLNMIVLQLVIERITGMSLEKYLEQKIFKPLGFKTTFYNPANQFLFYTPPTSEIYHPQKRNKGEVYDTIAFVLGGIAGNSGLFSKADELAAFAQMILQDGVYNGKQIIKSSTIREWINPRNKKAFVWNLKNSENISSVTSLSDNSFGFFGKTGTSLWIDRDRNLFVILLTNGIYPNGNFAKVEQFIPELHDLVVKAVDY